jgi:hypothetical protein
MSNISILVAAGLLLATGCTIQGYEGETTATGTIVVYENPPPPRVEVRPPAPTAQALWIDGYWTYSANTWVWVDGKWETPRQGYIWVRPTWRDRGGRWEFERGGWRAGGPGYDRGRPGEHDAARRERERREREHATREAER